MADKVEKEEIILESGHLFPKTKRERYVSSDGKEIFTDLKTFDENGIIQQNASFEDGIFFTTIKVGKEVFKGDFENSFWFFLFAVFSNFAWLIYFLFFNKRLSDEEIEL